MEHYQDNPLALESQGKYDVSRVLEDRRDEAREPKEMRLLPQQLAA